MSRSSTWVNVDIDVRVGGSRQVFTEINKAEPCKLIDLPMVQFKNNSFTEICSVSEEGSYLRLIDF